MVLIWIFTFVIVYFQPCCFVFVFVNQQDKTLTNVNTKFHPSKTSEKS